MIHNHALGKRRKFVLLRLRDSAGNLVLRQALADGNNSPRGGNERDTPFAFRFASFSVTVLPAGT